MPIVVLIVGIVFFASVLYTKLGWFKGFFHDGLFWHLPDPDGNTFHKDGSPCATCRYCGKHIRKISKGCWVSIEERSKK
jgi:hypothetical protein